MLLIEKECIRCVILSMVGQTRMKMTLSTRLADSECNIRAELETFKSAAMARESELQVEIDRLRQLIQDSSPVCYPESRNTHLLTVSQNRLGHTPLQDLLGDTNGEQPMELASPLEASATLPPSTPLEHAESPYIDPPSIPLPPSPLLSRSPSLSPSSSALLNEPQSFQISKEAQIERIEEELTNARRDLEEKENALNDLQAIVEDLRRQVVARGGSLERVDNVLLFDDAFR
jgi:hypothetical protein